MTSLSGVRSDRTTHRDFRVVADGLWFPEGPVAMADGSVLLVEMRRATLTRVDPQGRRETVAELGAAPNGAAIGPDGCCYIANNGGFAWGEAGGHIRPVGIAPDYAGGSIQRVDLATGSMETLYTHWGDVPLRGPNDLVFDRDGSFYFTDLGKRRADTIDIGAIYHARPDGSFIERLVHPFDRPNGIGLSPRHDRLYVNETYTGRVWSFDLDAPGCMRPANGHYSNEKGRVMAGLPGYQFFDGMAVEECGNVVVATMVTGGLSVVAPTGELLEFVPVGDAHVTNLCFGGPDRSTLYVTLGGQGALIAALWPRPGMRLAY